MSVQMLRIPLIFSICCPFGTAARKALAIPAALDGEVGHKQASLAAIQGTGVLWHKKEGLGVERIRLFTSPGCTSRTG